jgi:hypothetical protein
MDMEPESEWEWEVAERIRAGEDKDTAFAGVIQLFLNAADPGPLIDAVRKRYRIPAMTKRFIAAMFEEDPSRITNEPVLTYFDVDRRYRTVTDEARRRKEWIENGYKVLANDGDPEFIFWLTLIRALCVGHPNAQWGHLPLPDTPLKIKIKSRDPRYRPANPEIGIKRRVLRELVNRLVRGGDEMTVQAALKRVAAENNQSFETVRLAYYGA